MKIPKKFIENLKGNIAETWSNNSDHRELESDALVPIEINEIIDKTVKRFESGK